MGNFITREKEPDDIVPPPSNPSDIKSIATDINLNSAEAKENQLQEAAQTGNTKLAEILIEEGTNVNTQDKDGKTPLHWAAENGHLSVVELLVSKGADINTNSSIGPPYRRRHTNWTPLHYAALKNHVGVVRFLKNNKAQLIKDSGEQTALDVTENKDIIEILGGGEAYFLKVALTTDDLEKFKTLTKGEDFSKLSGWSVLHCAAQYGSLEIVKYLLHNGAKIDGDASSVTPLAAAAGSGNLRMVQYLVDEGADIDVASPDGWVPLLAASRASRTFEDTIDVEESVYLKLVQYFVEERGANLNVADKKGTTPLVTAARHNNFEIVKYLVEKGANIDVTDKLDSTVILSAACSNNLKIVNFLLEKGAAIDCTQGILGRLEITVLHLAAMYDSLEIVKFLVEEKGTDVNAGRGISVTPLHLAALSDSQKTIEYLLEKGADVNVTINFESILKIVSLAKEILQGSSMYVLILRVCNFFQHLLSRLESSSTSIKLTPNVLSKLFGYENKLLDSMSNDAVTVELKNRIDKLTADEPVIIQQCNLLKDFIAKRKSGNIEPIIQDFIFYLPDSTEQKIDGGKFL